jgi:hypothetical protein
MSEDKTVPLAETPAKETPSKESAPENNNSFYGGKYKSKDEFESAYKSLESKLGEQGEKIKKAEEFATYVQPIIDLARTDTEVFEILDKKLRSEPTKDKPEKADTLELRNATSDLLLARFEKEHGIDKMPSDEAAKVRQAIGAKVAELSGQQLGNVDLRRLTNTLENAYQLVKPKSSSEADSDDGSIPSISSSPGKSETSLSSEEAHVAEKLGLTKEDYLKSKKGLTKKYK